MSSVISSFLVGIGFEFDKKSAKQTESSIDSIKSKALQLGAVVAGAYGVKKLATNFADSADMLGKFSETFGGSAEQIQALGSALTTEGGSLESFMGQLESLERARARIKVGDVAFFAPAGKAGLDFNDVANAENATEAYLGLANAYAKMDDQGRINAAEALNLDAPSIRLLSQGREAVELLVEKYRDIRPLTDNMTSSAAEFNRQWVEIKANVGGVTDVIGSELLLVINDVTKSINSWFGSDRVNDIKAIAALTKATFGGGEASETANATGLPKWLFTKDIGSTVDTAFDGGEQSIGKHVTRILALLGSEEAKQSYLINEGVTTVPKYFESSPSLLPQRQEQQQNEQGSTTGSSLYNAKDLKQTINVNANFTLDGKVIDSKIIKVVDGMAQNAIDDISSSTGG